MTGFLSRVSLKRDVRVGALAPLLVPDGAGARIGAAHRLVWSLFDGDPDARRDFLWQEEAAARFLILSRRPPVDRLGIFEIETRSFAPAIEPGERLLFFLRANPIHTTSRPDESGRRRHDVVMHALKSLPSSARAQAREAALGGEGPVRRWLARQGDRAGFTLEDMAVLAYQPTRIPRDRIPRKDDVQISVVDLQGALRVSDPATFVTALMRGFGKARAFGCGLMLVKRDGR